MADELRILREHLSGLARAKPQWAARLERLLDAAHRLGAATPEPTPCGIHRDFYPDQVIVDGQRLHLIDFDLYGEGDPGLDIGNLLGHVTEYGLRTRGEPRALAESERAMEERFVELAGEALRAAVRAYATLTLVRHIYLSTVFPERHPLTACLLDLCEERLDVVRPFAPSPLSGEDQDGRDREHQQGSSSED
jgi:aminoglycoside phosphotransferase (APT) family kinase protein